MYNWYSTTDFCAFPLPRQWGTWCTPRPRKEWAVLAEILICRRGHRPLLNAVFMARLDHVSMEREGSENFRDWESLERYLCIWRRQNRYERAKYRGTTVEGYADGLSALGTMRFHRLLGVQLDFQLQKPVVALKMEILVQELDIIYMRESSNIIVVHIEVMGNASVSDCSFGLTIRAVVVWEMQGESSPWWEIWWRSQWGDWYKVRGKGTIVL